MSALPPNDPDHYAAFDDARRAMLERWLITARYLTAEQVVEELSATGRAMAHLAVLGGAS